MSHSSIVVVAVVVHRREHEFGRNTDSFHYHPIGPNIGAQTPAFANVFNMPSKTRIPEFTTRYARGTETRSRLRPPGYAVPREEVRANPRLASPLLAQLRPLLIANLRFARTAHLGRSRLRYATACQERRGIPSASANSCPPPYTPMAEI